MSKIAASPPKSVKSKAGVSWKHVGFVGLITAVASMLYIRFKSQDSGKTDLTKFPLGKYPFAAKISMSEFKKLVGTKQEGRSFNSFLMFNALDPGVGCQICPTIDAAFKSLASSIKASEQLKHSVNFATVDLSNGRDLFTMFRIETAPWLMFFKASKPGEPVPEPVAYNIKTMMTPETIKAFINEHMGKEIIPKSAVGNQNKRAIMITGGLLLFGAVVLAITGQLGSVVYNPWISMCLTLLFVTAMCSGYMFCKVRGVSTNFFAYPPANRLVGNLQAQTGAEMWIVGALNLINAAALVVLGSAIPKIENPVGKRITALIFICVFVYGFSSELDLFKRKFSSYPFTILK